LGEKNVALATGVSAGIGGQSQRYCQAGDFESSELRGDPVRPADAREMRNWFGWMFAMRNL